MDVRFLFMPCVICSSSDVLDPPEIQSVEPKRCINTQAYAPIVIPSHSTIKRSTTFILYKHLAVNVCGVICDFRCTPGHIANQNQLCEQKQKAMSTKYSTNDRLRSVSSFLPYIFYLNANFGQIWKFRWTKCQLNKYMIWITR